MKKFHRPPEEAEKKGVLPYLDPLPRFEVSQPGNVLRFFERGGRFRPEVGIPERLEEPGRPRTRLSDRAVVQAVQTKLRALPKEQVASAVGWWDSPALLARDARTGAVALRLHGADTGDSAVRGFRAAGRRRVVAGSRRPGRGTGALPC